MQEPVPVPKEDLIKRLVNAKKVMNKVDGGDFKKGNIDPTALQHNPDQMVPNAPKQNVRNVASNVVNEDKIMNSKLPDNIKQAMINNPIPTVDNISLSDNLDLSIVEGAKKLMEKEGLSSGVTEQPTISNQPTNNVVGGDLKSIIKETIKETLEEIVDRKLELILSASKTASINETLVLKVGDSIFKGKITGVNKAKKKD